jgi:hypothetical protein
MRFATASLLALSLWLPGMTMAPEVAAQAAGGKETRILKADILKHPIGPLALKYADAIHAGNGDEAMKLSSSQAQARWKSEPASERQASARFKKKFIPDRATLEAAIATGGILIIEGGSRATLNVVTVSSGPGAGGTVQSTSSTVAMPFVLEGGQWKLAQ